MPLPRAVAFVVVVVVAVAVSSMAPLAIAQPREAGATTATHDAAPALEPLDAEADAEAGVEADADARAQEPMAAPSASASASAPVGPTKTEAVVRLHHTKVFSIWVARGDRSSEQRAAAATAALQAALDQSGERQVRVEQQGPTAVVFVDARPVVELGPDDAAAAGEASVQLLAAKVATQIREAIHTERSRSQTLITLLSLVFVVFSALVALFLNKKVGELSDRARLWIQENPDRLPAMRLRSIEVVRPASFRAALAIGLSATKGLLKIGIAYGWLLLTLSLFQPTRGYAEKLTGFVFGPLYAMLARIVGSVPLLLIVAVAAIALVVLVRFVGLFFDSVQRGETKLEWVPADLAAPTSLLVRAAVVLVFFVIAAPLVTGNDDSALTRAGTVALVAVGLATTPLLASIAVGATVVYGRRLAVGDFADVGGRSGRVSAITLLEVRLLDEDNKELRVPHLLGLVHPTHVLGPRPLVSVEITLAPETASRSDIRQILLDAGEAVGQSPRVDLVSFDVDGATFRVGTHSGELDTKNRLCATLAAKLSAAGVKLGRRPSVSGRPG